MISSLNVLSLRGSRSLFALISAMILASTLPAQHTVSNLNNSDISGLTLITTNWVGASFTTDNANYTLSSVSLDLEGVTAGSLFVRLYSESAASPGSLLETLAGSSDPFIWAGAGVGHAYTSTGAALNPNTTYFIVAGVSSGNYSWLPTIDPNEDNSGAPVWTITNGYVFSGNGGTTWSTSAASTPKFSVTTSAIPEPSTYAALFGLATLGLAVWRRRCAV